MTTEPKRRGRPIGTGGPVKPRLTVTLSKEAMAIIEPIENKSAYIETLILKDKKGHKR